MLLQREHQRRIDANDGSGAAVRPRGLRVLAGSEGLLWPAILAPLVAVVVFRILSGPVVDPDYWWHLATGRWLLAHGRVPMTDPFSYTHAGQGWYAHEWLADLAIALANRAGGYAAGIVLTGAIVGAGAWLLWRTARYYGASARTAALSLFLGGGFLIDYLTVRPQVWGFALLAVLVHELAAHDMGRRTRLWHLPLVFALWINIHLSALTGGGVLALYAAHRLLRWLAAKREASEYERRRFVHVLAAGAVSALALCANPRGPALLWFARIYFTPGAARLRAIQEWQPPDPTPLNLALLVSGLAILAVAMVLMARRRVLWPGLPAVVFAPLALHASRYVPVFGVTLIPVLAWALTAIRGGGPSPVTLRLPRPFAVLLALATVLCALVAAFQGGEFRREPDATAPHYPTRAVAWLKQQRPGARLFNDYDWGGYLIDQFYPQRVVYIDGREEMYGERFLGRYLEVLHLQNGWRQTVDESGADAVLVARNGALAHALARDPDWQVAYQDTIAVVFTPSHNHVGATAE